MGEVSLLNRKFASRPLASSWTPTNVTWKTSCASRGGSWTKHRSVPLDNTVMEKCLQGDRMGREDTTAFRGMAAKLDYLSVDRPDLKVAALHASRHAANPKAGATEAIFAVAAYLHTRRGMKWHFAFQQYVWELHTVSDSDWPVACENGSQFPVEPFGGEPYTESMGKGPRSSQRLVHGSRAIRRGLRDDGDATPSESCTRGGDDG